MKYFFIVLFIIINSNYLVAQDNLAKLEVTYNMRIIPDSTNKENVIIAEMTLLSNENESIYFSRDTKNYYDFLFKKSREFKDGKINLGALPMYPKIRGSVFKNNKSIIATLPISKYNYSFEEPKLHWELLNQSKVINGMKCNLAKTKIDTGDTFFAWYTEEYPFAEGPFRFKSLPGLIIKIYNINSTITIDATEIKKSTEIIENILEGNNIKLKSKTDFIIARTKYIENPYVNTFGDDLILKDEKGTDYSKTRKQQLNSINVFLD